MTYRRLTQETGVLNALPATGDQGGLLNLFNRSVSTVEALYSNEFAILGDQSIKLQAEVTTETATIEVRAAVAGVRAFASSFQRYAAAPGTSFVRVMSVQIDTFTAGAIDGLRVQLTPARGLQLFDQAGALVYSSPDGVIPAAGWVRYDVWGNVSTGAIEFRAYSGLTTTGPLVTYSATSGWAWGAANGATKIAGMRAGKLNQGGTLTMWVDDMVIDDTATGLLAPPSDFVATTAPGPLTESPTGTVNVPFQAIPGATSYRIYRAPNVPNGGGPGVDTPGTYSVIATGVTTSPYADAGRPANTKLWYAYDGVN